MSKIVGIGANVYDTLMVLPNYPNEDTKLRAKGSKAAGGGPCATGLVAAAKLGGEVSFIGSMTDDDKANFLIRDFEKYGISTDLITIHKGYDTFFSIVMLSEESASRTIVFDKGNTPALSLNDKQKEAVKNAELLLVDGNEMSAAVEAARIAKENGTKVLLDAGGLYDGIRMPQKSFLKHINQKWLSSQRAKRAVSSTTEKKLFPTLPLRLRRWIQTAPAMFFTEHLHLPFKRVIIIIKPQYSQVRYPL